MYIIKSIFKIIVKFIGSVRFFTLSIYNQIKTKVNTHKVVFVIIYLE